MGRLGPCPYRSCLLNALESWALRQAIIMHSGKDCENGNTIIYRRDVKPELDQRELPPSPSAEG